MVLYQTIMKELLAPLITSAQSIDDLRDSVIKLAWGLKYRCPDIPLYYIGGPITADGPKNIGRNWALLGFVADTVRKDEGVFAYTNPYVGDLRRFPDLKESDSILYCAQLLESGVFDRLTLIEGWERSVGSRDEYRRALSLGIPVRIFPLDRITVQAGNRHYRKNVLSCGHALRR